jgi:transcriptional regulator with XRE-family HTH domain
LQRVEQRSGGRWKAVVVGSYERGDRAVTVQKLAELARFYGVPMSLLLPPEDLGSDDGVAIPIVLNLDRLYVLPRRKAGTVARYAADIAHRRGEHGALLRIRSTDIDSLADLCAISPPELVARLVSWGVLTPRVAYALPRAQGRLELVLGVVREHH